MTCVVSCMALVCLPLISNQKPQLTALFGKQACTLDESGVFSLFIIESTCLF